MLRILVLALFALFASAHCDSKENLNKQEKKLLKSLKKKYSLAGAYFVDKASAHKYIKLTNRDFEYAIANLSGNIIIAYDTIPHLIGYDEIKYNEAYKKGDFYYDYRTGWRDSVWIDTDECFLASKGESHTFYDMSGNKLLDFDGFLYERANTYLARKGYSGREGLISKDGRILIPVEYDRIIIDSECEYILVEKKEDGITKKGVFLINDDSLKVIPCLFNQIEFEEDSKQWKVSLHEYDSLITYNPSGIYEIEYRDEGEKMFAQGRYEEARRFYVLQQYNVPWAKFYIGATYYKEVLKEYNRANLLLEELERSEYESDAIKSSYIIEALDAVSIKGEKAINAFDEYLQTDESFFIHAKEMQYKLTELLPSISSLYLRNEYAAEKHQIRCNERKERLEQERIELLEQQRWERERIIEAERNRIEQQRLNLQREELRRKEQERSKQIKRQREAQRNKENTPHRRERSTQSTPQTIPSKSRTQTQKGNQSRSTTAVTPEQMSVPQKK